MKKTKPSLLIPSDNNFLSDKKISDRLYTWILLNGEAIEGDIYIDKKVRNGYRDVGINYRTFQTKIKYLCEKGYLEEYEKAYKIETDASLYKRYVYKDVAKRLLDTEISNIIKVYVYLGSLYDSYSTSAWFSYVGILKVIGYSSNKTQTSNIRKVKDILNKLSEMKLINFCKFYEKSEINQNKFRLLNVAGKGKGE